MIFVNFDPSAFVADQELIQAFSAHARVVDSDRDQLLFAQGAQPEGLYILHSGEVILTMNSPSGEEIVSFRANPGSLLGLPGLIGNAPYSLSAFAKKGAHITFVSREDFSSLMTKEPRLSLMILRVLANEVRAARQAITGR